MKKFWLSFLVIGTFTLYAAYFGNNGSLSYVAAPVTEVKKKTVTNTQVTEKPVVYSENDDRNPFEDDSTIPVAPKIVPKKTTPIIPKTVPQTTTHMTTPMMPKQMGLYKDGTYIGDNIYAYSDFIQVNAVISGGRLVDIQFPANAFGPNTSRQIYSYSMPILKSEAISAQSANINGVSGATYTSDAFTQSLAYALTQAKQ